MTKKAVTTGLVGFGLGYALWRAYEAGMDRAWRGFFGSPDLGPVDFATLVRRPTPNDALACQPGICPGAKSDIDAPVYPVPAAGLRAIIAQAAASEPNTVLIGSTETQDRFLVRTRLMRFPDTVVAQVFERGEGASTLALYSRSQIGRSDLGVNLRRLKRWLGRIDALVGGGQASSGR
jgi:uncharacterized protein (DUF1499 family)